MAVLVLLQEIGRQAVQLWQSRTFRRAIAGLLLLDAVLIGFHVLHYLDQHGVMPAPAFRSDFFKITTDRGLLEIAESGKLLAAGLGFLLLFRHRRSGIWLFLALLMPYLVIDNLAELHETLGLAMGQALVGPLGFSAQHTAPVGEFAFGVLACGVGGLALLLLVWAAPTTDRATLVVALAPLGLFASCAVLLDLLHSLVLEQSEAAGSVMAVAEDGGETVSLSLLTADALGLAALEPGGRPRA